MSVKISNGRQVLVSRAALEASICWVPAKSHLGDFSDSYEVSSDGRVRTIKRSFIRQSGSPYTVPRRLLGQRHSGDYLCVMMRENGRRCDIDVHVLVCSSFHGTRPSRRHEVNHKNGIKADNRERNLEWVVHKKNMEHASDTGLLGKITPDNLLCAIKGSRGNKNEIGRRLGVTAAAVAHIFNGRRDPRSRWGESIDAYERERSRSGWGIG